MACPLHPRVTPHSYVTLRTSLLPHCTAKSAGQVVPCHPRRSSWARSRPRPGEAGVVVEHCMDISVDETICMRNLTATSRARTTARSPKGDILKRPSRLARYDSSQWNTPLASPVPPGTGRNHIASFGCSASADSTTFLTSGNGSFLPISIHFTTVELSANPDLAM